ncbi:MAG: hypothetical protein Q7S22_04775 [Candidatus Micrarchaeota archaeon]|nr:hypothetical protein [Candidatus Micrarchaeota archaeon]
MSEVQKKQVIIPTGQHLDWLGAREAVRTKGGLPSNVLHDDILVMSRRTCVNKPIYLLADLRSTSDSCDYFEALPASSPITGLSTYYPAWAKEVIVYPEKNRSFLKGEDIVDAEPDEKGRQWILPACYVPNYVVNRFRMALVIDPANVEVSSAKVIIHPSSVCMCFSFIQNSGRGGMFDSNRVPYDLVPDNWENFVNLDKEKAYDNYWGGLSVNQKRWLFRNDGTSVRPILRRISGTYDSRDIVADASPTYPAGVAYVDDVVQQDGEKDAKPA